MDEQTDWDAKRKDPKKILWQGKHLDGFLLIVLESKYKLKGTLYLTEMRFELECGLHKQLIEQASPKMIVEEFLQKFDEEYLISEAKRAQRGKDDGSITIQ